MLLFNTAAFVKILLEIFEAPKSNPFRIRGKIRKELFRGDYYVIVPEQELLNPVALDQTKAAHIILEDI